MGLHSGVGSPGIWHPEGNLKFISSWGNSLLWLSQRSSFSSWESRKERRVQSYLTEGGKGKGNSTDKGLEVGQNAWNSKAGDGQVRLSCNVLVPTVNSARKVSLAPGVLHLSCLFQSPHALPLPCWCIFYCASWPCVRLGPSWEHFPTTPACADLSIHWTQLCLTGSCCLALSYSLSCQTKRITTQRFVM